MADTRYTVLQIVNEVQRKLGLTATNTLTTNKLAVQMVDFINDVCDDLSDFGNWQETLVSVNVTAVSGQRDYSIPTSGNVKNVGDIFFSNRSGPIRVVTDHDMRIMTRTTAVGQPTQFCVYGTDLNGNPNLRFRPTPGSNEDGQYFSILYFSKPPTYTTTDASSIVPFPGALVVLGTLAKAVLNESEGAPTDRYTLTQQDYLQSRKEALNRFNGDTGFDISFTPSMLGRRR